MAVPPRLPRTPSSYSCRMSPIAYVPRCAARSSLQPLRGLRYHLTHWKVPEAAEAPDVPPADGTAPQAAGAPPLLVLLHGWMDVGASFQFMVDELRAPRRIVAPDWRGFGRTVTPPTDSYWFADYLADLDALLDALSPQQPVDLLGHSMGGNVAMLYAGVRPQRIRRLVNLEGFGMPRTRPAEAPGRIARWLDEVRNLRPLRSYASVDEVAARLRTTNPRLPADKAAWLAGQWAAPDADGRWRLLADPAHRIVNPVLHEVEQTLATWRRIEAPLLFLDGAHSEPQMLWQGQFTRDEFEARLAVVPQVQRERLAGAGHMLHHDQPQALARALERFLEG